MCNKNRQVKFESVDIVYQPVRDLHEIIECYFTNEINQAFIARYLTTKMTNYTQRVHLFATTVALIAHRKNISINI